MPNIGPRRVQETAVTESFNPKSHNLVTFDVTALHKYTLELNPTAKRFC